LLLGDGVDLDDLVGQALVVEEGAHLLAERARLVLVQRQLQAAVVRWVVELNHTQRRKPFFLKKPSLKLGKTR